MDSIGHSYGTWRLNTVSTLCMTGPLTTAARKQTLAGGSTTNYDRLILSPGIDFIDGSVPGWDVSSQNAMPQCI